MLGAVCIIVATQCIQQLNHWINHRMPVTSKLVYKNGLNSHFQRNRSKLMWFDFEPQHWNSVWDIQMVLHNHHSNVCWMVEKSGGYFFSSFFCDSSLRIYITLLANCAGFCVLRVMKYSTKSSYILIFEMAVIIWVWRSRSFRIPLSTARLYGCEQTFRISSILMTFEIEMQEHRKSIIKTAFANRNKMAKWDWCH